MVNTKEVYCYECGFAGVGIYLALVFLGVMCLAACTRQGPCLFADDCIDRCLEKPFLYLTVGPLFAVMKAAT